MTQIDNQLVPFNQVQGIGPSNIPAYSNESDSFISFECSFVFGIFTGMKWQCVEYARRWLLLQRSCTFQSVNGAADMWFELNHVERVFDGEHFPVKKFVNGSSEKPECGSFLIYPRSNETPFGHVAVISEVGENFIRVVEQNYHFRHWSADYARQIPMIYQDGQYFLKDYYQIYGWIDIIGKERLSPFDSSMIDDVLPKYRTEKPIGQIKRLFLPENYFQSEDSMENEGNFVNYFQADEDFLCHLSEKSNETYRLLMLATDHVIRSDDLLTHFEIPEVFWLPIRRSWLDRTQPDLLGHFDWKFDGFNMKLTNYRSDNASMLLNCAVLQEKWAENLDIDYNFHSTFQFHRSLVRQWKNFNIQTIVHLLIEDEQDDMLTVLYMQNVLKEANIESKICLVPKDLRWENGWITDEDGEIIKMVWGIWKWEKIFKFNHSTWNLSYQTNPDLSDVFMHENIRVIEPLWKSITNHRAMRSILHRMFPHQLISVSERLIDEEKNIDNLSKKTNVVNVVSWMIRGLFSGFVVRDDDPEKSEAVCCII